MSHQAAYTAAAPGHRSAPPPVLQDPGWPSTPAPEPAVGRVPAERAPGCPAASGGALSRSGDGCWPPDRHTAAARCPPPEGTFTQVSAGSFHTCGVRTDATLTCWGFYDNGQSTPPCEADACDAATTLCASLGDDLPPSLLNQDLFRFTGAQGETVTLTLAPDPDTGLDQLSAPPSCSPIRSPACFSRVLTAAPCPTPCRPRCPRRRLSGDGGRTPRPAARPGLSGHLLCDAGLVWRRRGRNSPPR